MAKKTKGKGYGPKGGKGMKGGKGKGCRSDGHLMQGPCDCGERHDLIQTRWG